MRPIIDPDRSLTFSDYYSLKATDAQIAEYFGYELQKVDLILPRSSDSLYPHLKAEAIALGKEIIEILPLTNLDSEIARREILISPLMLKLLKMVRPQLYIEYALSVSSQLKGTIDYYLRSESAQALIVEAKLADEEKGFKQLIAELVAIRQFLDLQCPIYGAVTTGRTWHFAKLDPESRMLERDINFYTEPQGIEELLSVLVGILGHS